MPLWKNSEWSLMHAISYEPCMLGFWNFMYSTAWGFFLYPTHPSGADCFTHCSPTQGSTWTLPVILWHAHCDPPAIPLNFHPNKMDGITVGSLSSLSPLTLEVVGAPQMTLQQYLSILPCLPLPSGNLQTPFPSIPWCYLPISSSVFLSFLLLSLSRAELSSPCQRILRCGHTIWVSVSLPWLGDHHALQLHSGFCCEPPRHMVFVGNVQKSHVVSHLKGLDPSLYFCCQGPALTGIKKGR